MSRVLIAEDEPSIALSLEFLLSAEGHEVLTAASGSAALALAEKHKPDLLVLDVMLPVVNGFEVCRRLRANAALRALRILMLTARGGDHEMAYGLAGGADAYVTKPFATRDLMRIVAELLDTGAERRPPYRAE